MKEAKKSNFDEAIIYTQILNEKTLLVVDAFTTIRYLNIENLAVKYESKMAILHPRYNTKVISFSSDGSYFASISQDARESRLYETKSQKNVATVDRHQGEVFCIGIDPKDRYMFSCGEDGMVFGLDIKSAQLAFTLPRHTDYVNDIAFSSDGQLVATASYDKNISLFNLTIMAPKGKLRAHSVPVLKVEFLSKNRLFSIDKNSSAIIWDVIGLKVITRLKGIHDDISEVVVGNDNTLLFLGTKLGYVLVYDLSTYEQISRRYIKLNNMITALNFDENNKHLIVGTDNGELLFYNIFEGEDDLERLLHEKKYNLMYECMEKNPLLKYTKYSQIVDALWKKTVQKAKEFLEKSDKGRAIKLFENFIAIPAKKQLMQKLIEEYAEYDKFLVLIKNKKIALAYALANVHPLYKETKVYKEMEVEWENSFALAQRYLLDQKLSYKAQEILAPYRGISEKTKLIQDLVLNVHVYKRFKDSIGQKEFKLSFELVKQNPFLKEYPEYKALMKYSDTLYMKAQLLLGNGDTHAAIKIFRILLDFDEFKDEAKETISDIENRQKFFNAIKEEDIILAYNLLDESYDLQDTQEGKRLQASWEGDMEKASEFAALSDIAGVKGVLEKYMKIRSKNMAIATLLSRCYITQLESALGENQPQKIIECGIKNYILYYGLTEQIRDFFNNFQAQYPYTKLNIESQASGSIENWRPSMIVSSILT